METNIDPLCSKKVGQTNKRIVNFRHILASKNPIDRTNHPSQDVKVNMTFVKDQLKQITLGCTETCVVTEIEKSKMKMSNDDIPN